MVFVFFKRFCSAGYYLCPLQCGGKSTLSRVLNNEENVWHGPDDISPVVVAANLHIDMSITNPGVQEYTPVNEAMMEVFSVCPEIDCDHAYLSDRPGLGGINLKEAAKYPVLGGISVIRVY